MGSSGRSLTSGMTGTYYNYIVFHIVMWKKVWITVERVFERLPMWRNRGVFTISNNGVQAEMNREKEVEESKLAE